MKDIDFRLDPRIPDEPEDGGKAMMAKIREALKTQMFEEGRRKGYDEGFGDGYQSGYNQALESFLKLTNDFVGGNKI